MDIPSSFDSKALTHKNGRGRYNTSDKRQMENENSLVTTTISLVKILVNRRLPLIHGKLRRPATKKRPNGRFCPICESRLQEAIAVPVILIAARIRGRRVNSTPSVDWVMAMVCEHAPQSQKCSTRRSRLPFAWTLSGTSNTKIRPSLK
jgi:hypothetical protein